MFASLLLCNVESRCLTGRHVSRLHKESILRNVVNGFRHGGDRSSCVCFGFATLEIQKVGEDALEALYAGSMFSANSLTSCPS
ncbi:hypothetical protein YC2023_075854 [Brassica napus]